MAALEANQMLDRESELATQANKQPSCCETGTCGVDCPNFKREPEGNSFVADNNTPVVIVATTTESEFPPFAEAPLEDSPTLNQTEFESGQAELENPIIETPKVDAMAYQGNFSPISTPVATPSPMKSAAEVIASSQALVDFENWTDEDWNDVFGPVPGTPCQACEQGTCNSKGCLTAQPTGPKPTMHDYASTGMAAVDELVPDADIQPSPQMSSFLPAIPLTFPNRNHPPKYYLERIWSFRILWPPSLATTFRQ